MEEVTPTTNHLPQILFDASTDVTCADDVTNIDEIARKAKLKRVHSEKTHATPRLNALKVVTSQCDAGLDTVRKHLLLTSHDDALSASSSSVFSGGAHTQDEPDSGLIPNPVMLLHL